MAGWSAYFVFMFRAVNVNKTVSGIGIMLVETVKPEDSRHNQILRGRQRISGFQRHATLKNRAGGRVAANFFRYAEAPGRCFHAALLGSDSESGGGHGISADWRLVFLQREPLIAN